MKIRLIAEIIGTFWLVFGGCGSAVLSAAYPEPGIGLSGVSLAFGLTLLTMAYAIGHISGCHLSSAVTVGLAIGNRFPWNEVPLKVADGAGTPGHDIHFSELQLQTGLKTAAVLVRVALQQP